MSNRITWQEREDQKALVMGSLGFSATHIAEQTGLSTGQVYYRLGKMGIRLRDYRNGLNPIGRHVLRAATGYVQKRVDTQVRKQLKAQNQVWGRKRK